MQSEIQKLEARLATALPHTEITQKETVDTMIKLANLVQYSNADYAKELATKALALSKEGDLIEKPNSESSNFLRFPFHRVSLSHSGALPFE